MQNFKRWLLAGLAATCVGASVGVGPSPLAGGTPVAQASGLQVIPFESVNNNRVVMGSLASRSQRQPVSIAGIGPYTITGTDSASSQTYQFVTDYNYNPSGAHPAYGRESDERSLASTFSGSSNTNASRLGRNGVLMLKSYTQCNSGNTFGGATTYCSSFGPSVYSEVFEASVGQSVSFDWSARKVDDDYEIYAFLVKVDETTPGSGVYDYGTNADHTLLAYGRGQNQGWTTASGAIPEPGHYRFRFINGSYDGTGGYVLGSEMYIDSVVKVGLSNPITFEPLGDKVAGAAPFTVTATAPGGAVTFTSTTTNRCTVSGNTVTLVTGQTGVCTIVADQAGDGSTYVPAESLSRSFSILAAPTAPTNSGVPLIFGTVATGQTLTMSEGTWGDGGSAIIGTAVQWRSTVGGVTSDIAGLTGSSCYVVPLAGGTITVRVTKTNAIGSTSATSAATISGFTCGEPQAPAWTDQSLVALKVGVAVSDGVSANGIPAPTYSVTAGALPAGLTLNSTTGALTGTPTSAGAYSFTITAANGTTPDVTALFTGSVEPADAAPSWTDQSIGHLQVGVPLEDGVSADGFPVPTYSVTAGTLPDGLTLDPATGAIVGTPITAGPYSFSITATNGVAPDQVVSFSGDIEQADVAPGWTDDDIGHLQVAEPFVDGVFAGGYPAVTYAVTAGTLPAGLSLDAATGAITGTPLEDGPYDFTITASNGVEPDVTKQFTGSIERANEAPAWNDETVDIPQAGVPFADGVTATGYPAPTYAVSAGSLPAGLSLDSTTGAITGTPTAVGPYEFEVTASNGIGDDVTASFSGSVLPPPADPLIELAIDVMPGQTVGGRTVNLSGVGLAPSSTVEIVLDSGIVLGSVVVGLDGRFTTDVSLPTEISVGSHTITAVGTALLGEEVTASRDFLVDWSGLMTAGLNGDGYTAVDPLRVLDTRSGEPVQAWSVRRLVITDEWGIDDDATSLVLNLAVTEAEGAGFITVYSCAVDRPWASSLDFAEGDTVANLSIVSIVGTDEVCIYTMATTHIVVDLNGYYSPEGEDRLVAQAPVRVLDTRDGGVPVSAGTIVEIPVIGEGLAPAGSTAVAVTVAAVEAEGDGYVTLYPCGTQPPLASNLNYVTGQTIANHAITKVGEGGAICAYVFGSTHVLVDLNASFGDSATEFASMVPHRVLDTRDGAAIPAGTVVEIPLATAASGMQDAVAFAINVTSTEPMGPGFVTVFPCGMPMPLASNVNYPAGATVGNHATATVGDGGSICVFTMAEAHLVVDVEGVYVGR